MEVKLCESPRSVVISSCDVKHRSFVVVVTQLKPSRSLTMPQQVLAVSKTHKLELRFGRWPLGLSMVEAKLQNPPQR